MDEIVDYKFENWCWHCQNYVTIWNQRKIRTIHDCSLNHGIKSGTCEMVFGTPEPSLYEQRN